MMDWRTQIQVGVVWADIILCEVGKALLYVLAAGAVGGLAALVCEYYRRRRGNFARRAKLSRPKGPGWHVSNQRFETCHLRRR